MKVWAGIHLLQKLLLTLTQNVIKMVPPRDLTVTHMYLTKLRIRLYWKTTGRLPTSLSDLPTLESRDNSTIDGWGRSIKYDITGATTVTLSSLGADGTAGDAYSNEVLTVLFDVSKD